MIGDWAFRLVRWWVRVYTRGLPEPVAQRRIAEVDADLWDQAAASSCVASEGTP